LLTDYNYNRSSEFVKSQIPWRCLSITLSGRRQVRSWSQAC